MKKLIALFLIIFSLSLIAAPCIVSFAKDTDSQRVFDEASLLKSRQISDIEAQIKKLEKKINTPVVIWTVPEVMTYDDDEKAEICWQFLDEHGLIDEDENGKGAIILFVQYLGTAGDNDLCIYSYGKMQDKFDDSKVESIMDAMYDDMRSHDFSGAFSTFVDEVKDTLIRSVSVLWIIISAIIASIAGLIAVSAKKSEYKLSGSVYRYNLGDKSGTNLREQANILISENTTREIISSGSSGGSRSGGHHTSSGGHSYSGGSRRF